MRRNTHTAGWRLLLLILLLVPASAAAEDGGERAERFVRLLLDGESAALHDLLTPQMQAALGAAKQAVLVAQLVAQNGAVQGLGEAWLQDTVQGYRRYHVPVAFQKATLDLLVVVDGSGRVGGLFVVPHAEVPPEDGAVTPGREIEVRVGEGERALGGLVTLPEGDGPFAGVVLVHGSGPSDRDETVGAHKVFRDLAWGLAERGVATLRYDKRSFARPQDLVEMGEELTVEHEVVADAAAAVGVLRRRPEVDGGRVYVLGHSLGGMVVPRIAAAVEPRPAGMVSLAGAVLPLPEKILTQTRYLVGLDGEVSAEEKARLEEIEKAVAALRAVLDGTAPEPGEPLLGAPVGYFRDLEAHDPPAEAAALGLPVLVLQGERDYQVTREDFARWHAALGGKDGACLVSYEGLDHLFRHGTGPSDPADYQRPGPFTPRVLDDLAAWVSTKRCP